MSDTLGEMEIFNNLFDGIAFRVRVSIIEGDTTQDGSGWCMCGVSVRMLESSMSDEIRRVYEVASKTMKSIMVPWSYPGKSTNEGFLIYASVMDLSVVGGIVMKFLIRFLSVLYAEYKRAEGLLVDTGWDFYPVVGGDDGLPQGWFSGVCVTDIVFHRFVPVTDEVDEVLQDVWEGKVSNDEGGRRIDSLMESYKPGSVVAEADRLLNELNGLGGEK